MASKFRFVRAARDQSGAALLDFALAFPVIIVVALGTIDFSLLYLELVQAQKASYVGARTAVVMNPVASGINSLTFANLSTKAGELCFNANDGSNNSAANCPNPGTVCTPGATGGTCTNSYTFDVSGTAAFPTILQRMQRIYPKLTRQNVTIAYQGTNLGFVGRPGGVPLNVTVSLRCLTHRFAILGSALNWVFAVPSGCPNGTLAGFPISAFPVTLPSEDLVSN